MRAHRVVAEVLCSTTPSFSVIAAPGRVVRQPHQRGALHLRLDRQRIDRQVAVHAGGHLVQLRARRLVDRGLDHVGDHRVEGLVHRHAPGTAFRQRLLAVAGLGHRQVQRRLVARVLVADQLLAVGDRVLPVARAISSISVSITKAVWVEPTERHHSTGTLALGVMHGQVHRHVVRLAHAFDHGGVDAVLDHEGLERRARE